MTSKASSNSPALGPFQEGSRNRPFLPVSRQAAERRPPPIGAAGAFLVAAILAAFASATPLRSLEGEASALADHLQAPATLILIASVPEDLAQVQRLLTAAYAANQPALVLIQLPENRLKAAALRHAARDFFASDFSQSRVYYTTAADRPAPPAKTLLLAPNAAAPLYAAPGFPQELPKPPKPERQSPNASVAD